MVSNWKELGWKLADNFASMKAEVLIFGSWALAVGLITSPEWLTIALVVIGGRVATDAVSIITQKIRGTDADKES